MSASYESLPPNLPVPEDDGAADHLAGTVLPPLRLAVAGGGSFDLREAAAIGTLVAFVYPRTGTPGQPLVPYQEVIQLIEQNPQLPNINSGTVRNEGYLKSRFRKSQSRCPPPTFLRSRLRRSRFSHCRALA